MNLKIEFMLFRTSEVSTLDCKAIISVLVCNFEITVIHFSHAVTLEVIYLSNLVHSREEL